MTNTCECTRAAVIQSNAMPDGGNATHIAWKDALALRDTYEEMLRPYNGKPVRVLDYGCGNKGLSRLHWEFLLDTNRQARLLLYDPVFQAAHHLDSFRHDVKFFKNHSDLKELGVNVSIISIAYVLCLLEHDESISMLRELHDWFPNAQLVVADYILHGRSQIEVLQLLQSEAEKKWQTKMGKTEFCRTHARFSQESLREEIYQGNWAPVNSDLQPSGLKATITAC